MKYTAFALIILVIIAIGITVYAWTNTALVCTATGILADSAEKRGDEFFVFQTALENNAVQGTVYRSSLEGDPSAYIILIYNIKIENKYLLDAEMIEIQINPIDGDVACFSGTGGISKNIPITIKALSTDNVLCTLITKAENHAVRDFVITYYIWGRPYSVQCTFG